MPGFLFGRRHKNISGAPGYFNFYLVETPEVLTSKPYLERLDHPTPMTRKIMSEVFVNMNRTVCRRTLRRGSFRGAFAVLARFNQKPDEAALSAMLEKLTADTSVAGGEIWIALDPAGMPVSMEEKLRGGDKKIAGALMIDTLYQEDAETVGAQLAKQFPSAEIGSLSRALPDRTRRSMKALLPLAETIAQRLIARRETIAIAESSTGGLIAAALLAVPGASAYFIGGAVVYTKAARAALLGIGDAEMQGLRPATEAYALLLARRVRERHGAIWGLGETGATGPTGNRYGDPAGHTCIGVFGPAERAMTLRTGSAERLSNMEAFAKRALELLVEIMPG